MAPLLLALIDPISHLIDKLIPDKQAAAQAKLDMLKEENQQALQELQISMSAILAEGGSADPWTSRARPSFMYVMYILILAAIPMGIVHAINPVLAQTIAEGLKEWLTALPDQLWDLFKFGYGGYVMGRSWEKVTEIKNR